MAMSMKQILDGYGYGIIQDCTGLLQTLKKQGISKDDFLAFVEKTKKEGVIKPKPPVKKTENKSKKMPKFLKSGETEKMNGVVCSKCHGEVYVEALCRHNPLVRQGFVRRGICGNCNAEFGVR